MKRLLARRKAPIRIPAHRYDPLGPLADAIGSMTGTLSGQVANALHQVLDAATPQSRHARLQLIRHLVDVESQTVGIERPRIGPVIGSCRTKIMAVGLGHVRAIEHPSSDSTALGLKLVRKS